MSIDACLLHSLDDAIQQARCVETMARFLRMPHEKFFKLLDYIFDNMEKEKKAVAWELEPNYDEAVIHKNERVVVPEKDVAHGGTLSGIFFASHCTYTIF
jgi:hypothetical protein